MATDGRFGMARRSEDSSRSALLTVRAGALPVFDLRDGFAIRIDLKLEAVEEAVKARGRSTAGRPGQRGGKARRGAR